MELYSYRAEVYTVPQAATAPQLPDVRNWRVEAHDGHIGRVDDATYGAGASCLVVDTAFWTGGTKRMIPAGVVQRVESDEETVHIAMTKDQIRDAPDYDPQRHGDDEAGYRLEVGRYYEPYATWAPTREPPGA